MPYSATAAEGGLSTTLEINTGPVPVVSGTLNVVTSHIGGTGYSSLGQITHKSVGIPTGNGPGFVYDSSAWTLRTDTANDLTVAEASGSCFVLFGIDGTLGGTSSPPDQLRVYDCWIDVLFADASTGVFRPTIADVIVGTSNGGTVTNPANAIDTDSSTYATVTRSDFGPLSFPTYLHLHGFKLYSYSAGVAPPEVWILVGEVRKAVQRNHQNESDDASNYQSDAREIVPTILNPGNWDIELNRVRPDAGQTAMVDSMAAKTLRRYRLTLPPTGGQTTGDSETFTALVERYEDEIAPDKIVKVSASLKITGLIARGVITQITVSTWAAAVNLNAGHGPGTPSAGVSYDNGVTWSSTYVGGNSDFPMPSSPFSKQLITTVLPSVPISIDSFQVKYFLAGTTLDTGADSRLQIYDLSASVTYANGTVVTVRPTAWSLEDNASGDNNLGNLRGYLAYDSDANPPTTFGYVSRTLFASGNLPNYLIFSSWR